MNQFRILSAAFAAAMTLCASGAAFADSGEEDDGQELAAVLDASTSITQAIATAEQQTGGQAVKVDVDDDGGAYLYEVKIISQDKIIRVYVDMDSSQVVRTDEEGLLSRLLNGDDKDALAGLMASPTTLASAIATAEQHTGGKAIEASFDDESDATQLEVAVAANNVVQQVMIDRTTGEVLAVNAADSDEDDDE